jgi:hypothetical protein
MTGATAFSKSSNTSYFFAAVMGMTLTVGDVGVEDAATWLTLDHSGPKPVTPDEMRAAMRESGLLPENRGGPGTGSEVYSGGSTFSSRSSVSNESP